jgi:predicted dehydrogenase
MHREVVTGLAELGRVHIMCEKPLATTLEDCLEMYAALQSNKDQENNQMLFSIGHVLRYSPHNMMLRNLILEDRVIGDVLSVVHTEPVGWWHFTHS